jgi:hypothetical protein
MVLTQGKLPLRESGEGVLGQMIDKATAPAGKLQGPLALPEFVEANFRGLEARRGAAECEASALSAELTAQSCFVCRFYAKRCAKSSRRRVLNSESGTIIAGWSPHEQNTPQALLAISVKCKLIGGSLAQNCFTV